MNATNAAAVRTPWHLWVVGVVAVLWNAFGCYDYIMTRVNGADYLRGFFTEEQVQFYVNMPIWASIVWPIGVWGGLAGAVLLLLRSKWALHAFVASLIAFVLSLVHKYALSNGGELFGSSAYPIEATILGLCLFFAWYAWFATKNGVLR
ncbi:MAG: hypothetical protein AB7T59_00530 [Hyphomonadaceae bacterium]